MERMSMATATSPETALEAKYQRLVSKYNDLSKRHRDLQERNVKLERYAEQAYEKYKTSKAAVQQWQEYVDRHRLKQDDPPTSISSKAKEAKDQHNVGRISSSQTTEGEQEPSQAVGDEAVDEFDEVTVVSARAVKRRRNESTRGMPPPVRVKHELTSQRNPIDLVSEDFSSPKLKRQKHVRTETSDLDALGEHINTPRKHMYPRARSEETGKPAPLLLASSSLSEGDLSEAVEIRVKPETGVGVPHLDAAITSRDFAAHTTYDARKSNVLLPLSVNIPSLSKTTIGRTEKKRKRDHNDRQNFALLAEDGDDQTSRVVKVKREHTPKATSSRRLDSLLEEPSPDRLPLPKRSTPQTSLLSKEGGPSRKEQQNYKANASAQRQPAAFKVPRGLEDPPPDVLPEDQPLRCLPLTSLRLDDFKINPRYLGADYAFADTFRGREQRRCLQGCTRPECCGDTFRKAVEIGAVRSDKTDPQVLEEYLGPNFDVIMGAYPPDKRKDLLIQARAYAYANQHGKHRQAFERRSTPPGFWRTDMPTTQEQEEDRGRALEMERQKIEERWREAMREDGRWLFRDE